MEPVITIVMKDKFPSPCGEKVGINIGKLLKPFGSIAAFPSPCGEKVGININDFLGNAFASYPGVAFPSPCGEKVGINERSSFEEDPEGRCRGFRPLAGKR